MHHHTIQINHQPDVTIFQFIILTSVYSATCFRCFPVHHQQLNDCNGSLWFYLRIVVIVVLCSWSGRPAASFPTALWPYIYIYIYSHNAVWKTCCWRAGVTSLHSQKITALQNLSKVSPDKSKILSCDSVVVYEWHVVVKTLVCHHGTWYSWMTGLHNKSWSAEHD